MRINEILECYNAAIDGERITKDLNIRGHFVATLEIKKEMGPYKKANINIVYVNRDKKLNIPFVSSSWTERVLIDSIDKFTDTAEKQALIKFIVTITEKDTWQKVVEGRYGIE